MKRRHALLIPGYIEVGGKAVEAKGLLDSGADAIIINAKLVEKYNLPTVKLPRPLTFRNADDSVNRQGTITHRVEGNFIVKDKTLPTRWYVANLGRDDIILGMPWIKRYNPTINWRTGSVTISNKTIVEQQKLQQYQATHDPPPGTVWGLPAPGTLQHLVLSFVETLGDILEEEPLTHSPAKVIDRLLQMTAYVNRTNKSTEIAIEARKNKVEKPLDELLPAYALEFRSVFEKKAADRFPPSTPWDHAIELKKEFDVHKRRTWSKIYPLSVTEQEELRKFIDENMAKGFIRESSSSLASPFFFVSKKDGTLRPVQDYRALNEATVKNVYPLPLIDDLINKVQGATIFTKVDIRAGYNNIRIKEGDQWKASFNTPLGQYEPMVMFFGLCNAPATFQSMMNHIFDDMIREGWLIIYMDDILILSHDLEVHRTRTKRVLKRLQEHDLYLKAEKCEFEVTEVEYLGVILRPGEVLMDPVKLKAIHEWPSPKTVKQVQAFLGFGNFYRRFIRDYSTIARPLTELTRKDKVFDWSSECESAFQCLKTRFMEEPVLKIPDPLAPFQVECDASKVATGAVLRQQGPTGFWHPCAFLSKSFTSAERNYQIYDRELLAIVRAFEAWRHFLQGSPHQVEVLTDHKNLTYFKSAHKVNRRQARWQIFLDSFNYILKHNPGKSLVQADTLSRRPDHDGGEDDNKDVIVLREELFAKAINTDLQERIRDNKARTSDLIPFISKTGTTLHRPDYGKLEDWTDSDGIVLYQDKVYVPPDDDLRREVVRLHHEPVHMAHPGIQKTKDLVKREYYWEHMDKYIQEYVRGCATCQTTKVRTNPTKPPLLPIPHSGDTRPFRVITIDHIVDLPDTEDGYNAIQVVVDHDVSKAVVLSACNKQVTAVEAAKLLWRDVFSRFGLPDRIISDRGPQFSAQVF